MSTDGPPDWDVPPASPDDYGQPSGGKGGGKKPWKEKDNQTPAPTPEQTAAAVEGFYEWLLARDTRQQLAAVLPDHVDVDVFMATARTAVLNKPELAREDLRPSLLVAVMKAATQGLLPDGKQGALVPRWNKDKKCQEVVWQPMVWGIVKLGRETGAIKSIRAVIVFNGENSVEIDEVAGTISHRRGAAERQIVAEAYNALMARSPGGTINTNAAAFLSRIDMAYCVIVPADGSTPTMRWMPQARIVLLREASAAKWGPWSGSFVDEMVLKGIILLTSKWIDLDPSSAPAQRFRAALMTDMEVDFTRQGQISGPSEQDERRAQAALPPPADKLSTLEDQIMGAMTEKVTTALQNAPATNVSEDRTSPASSQDRAGATGGGDGRVTPPGTTATAGAGEPHIADGDAVAQVGGVASNAPPADHDVSFIDRACEALEDLKYGAKWMSALIFAAKGIESAGDLGRLKQLPSVVENLKSGPPAVRSQISTLLAQASQNLAPKPDDVEQPDTENVE